MVSTGKMLAFINELGGGGAAPSEVVILPETVAVKTGEAEEFLIKTPLSATPTVGATALINYNGVKYTSPIVYNEQNAMFAMGNTEMVGIQGGNADAPFLVALLLEGQEGTYGMIMSLDGATTITLSIVQVGAASGGETSGGGVFITSATSADMQNVTMDKPLEDAVAAARAGKHVACYFAMSTEGTPATYILPLVAFSTVDGGMTAVYCVSTGIESMMINDGYDANGDRLTMLITQ